ncbi:methyltransferase [Microbispora sp. ATCC PTA-5024]|uniref:methyltransferase n=1 Tax=Microbispora sp. ATCC PTA-5024 TaxID=316330 RepID=UPI000405A0F7|nr:methyltransferase [Microbispora sp. ATCC PTA-5024]
MKETPEAASGREDAALDQEHVFGTLLQMITGHQVAQIVRTAAALSIPDHVAAGARTAGEVAERASTHPATTYRLMRACASIGLLAYEGHGRFVTTPMGELLREGVPGSLRDTTLHLAGYSTWVSWAHLPDAVREGRTQVYKALGMDQFTYFSQHPEEGDAFASSGSSMSEVVAAEAVGMLDLSGVSTAVDVGGANGRLVLGLMRANPALHGVVLDLPHVTVAAARAAEDLGFSDRFSVREGDFFDEVPTADLYLLKWILHDWDDEACVRLLRNCRAAARPGARALVFEIVLGEVGTPDFGAVVDMNMLSVTDGGRERHLHEYDALFAAGGWRRVSARPTRSPLWIMELEAA